MTTGPGPELIRRERRLTLADEAYEAVVEAIVDRRIAPGAHLTTRVLVEQLGMSATPVREALLRLASERLVVQATNRGCTVAPLLTRTEYRQLFATRRLLEHHAVTIASPDRTRIDRAGVLARLMPHMEHGDHYAEFQDFNKADRAFHLTLLQLSGNPFLERAWSDLHFHLHVGRLYTGSGVIDFSEALAEHLAISDAVTAGDFARASELTFVHISAAELRLIELVPSFQTAGDEVESFR